MKLINVDELIDEINEYILYDCDDEIIFREILNDLPDAVIRCKDCKYCLNPSWLHGWNGICTKSFCNVPEYHYCGYGERKPDE